MSLRLLNQNLPDVLLLCFVIYRKKTVKNHKYHCSQLVLYSGDFLNIFLRLWGFGDFSYENLSYKKNLSCKTVLKVFDKLFCNNNNQVMIIKLLIR